ncbi:PHP domain-containing protein [Thiopseudomonas denitrificans]
MDLHCHSTASDGALTPTALVQRAHERGIRILALTDHDTLKGIGEARQACDALGMHLVNGIELSCTWAATTIHVLGYDFALDSIPLNALIRRLQDGRWQRAEKISQRLAAKGMPGCLEGARAIQAGLGEQEQPPARPHFAAYMVQAGYARDHAEAFDKWLGAGKLGDVKQFWPEFAEVMQVLGEAQAFTSLAHPYHYSFTRSKRRRLVADFAERGGHALEVSNGPQPPEQVGTLAVMAREFGLKVTAGSDFHMPRNWSELGLYRAPASDLTPLWHSFAVPDSLREPEIGVLP